MFNPGCPVYTLVLFLPACFPLNFLLKIRRCLIFLHVVEGKICSNLSYSTHFLMPNS